MEAVIEGFRDERAQAEEDRRAMVAVRMWKLMLLKLRIKERVDGYRGLDEDVEEIEENGEDGGYVDEGDEDDYGGGGFLPE